MASVTPRPKPREMSGAAWGAAMGIGLFVLSFLIRDTGKTFYGPRFWPQMIGVLLVAVNAYVIVRAFFGQNEPTEDAATLAPMVTLSRPDWPVWLAAILVVGLPLIVYVMGFLAGSAAFLAAFMRALGYARWGVIAVAAPIFAVSLTWFFTAGVYTPLPPGKGPFYSVSAEFARMIAR